MAFELLTLSTKLTEASVADLLHAVRAIEKLQNLRSVGLLLYPSLRGNPSEDWEIFLFSDATLEKEALELTFCG